MNSNKIFNSQFIELNSFALKIENEQIKKEPMFFNSDLDYAYKNGGDITKSFIDHLPNDWKRGSVVFDSRVHMLMPGWYPAIQDVPKEVPDINPNNQNDQEEVSSGELAAFFAGID